VTRRGPRDDLLDVEGVGGQRDDAAAEDVVGVTQPIEIDVEQRDVRPQAESALGRVQPDGARAQDGHVAVGHAGHSGEEDPATAVRAPEIMRALLDGESAGDLAHWRQKRKAAVGSLHRLVGDGDGVSSDESPDEVGHGGQMQIGEERLAVANARHLLGQRLLHLENEFGLTPQLCDAGELGARRGKLFVPEAASRAGSRLHEDAMARVGEGPGPRGGEGDPLLADLDLLRHADDHVFTMLAPGVRGKMEVGGGGAHWLESDRI